QPPIAKQVVLAIDPGFRTGCKVAVLDAHGTLLEHGVIHPHPPQSRRHEAKVYLKDLVMKHQVDVVAIGNGTACRETEELIAEVINEGTHFHQNPGVPFPMPAPTGPSSPTARPEPSAAHPDAATPPPTTSDGPLASAPEATPPTSGTPEPGGRHGDEASSP